MAFVFALIFDDVYFPARDGTHFTNGCTEAQERERSLILISNMLNVAYLSQAINASYNHSTKTSPNYQRQSLEISDNNRLVFLDFSVLQ